MKTPMYDYLIVGAGLYGAVFARRMTDAGKKCLVIDRRRTIGGNIYTENKNGIPVHIYGAHIFHTSDKAVWDFVNSFEDFCPYRHEPKANYRGKRYSLPFNMNTFNELWGVTSPDEAKKHIESDISSEYVKEPKNLEEQAINLVGREVYEKLVKGYTEKQWGRSCKELPPFIIKRLPLRFTFDNNYFNDDFQGIPKNGYTPFIEKLLSGIEVRLNTDFFSDREKFAALCKKLVFTGTVDSFYNYCFGTLDYRTLRFETEVLPVSDYQGTAVVNETASEVPYTRTIEHRFFSGITADSTVITREFSAEYKTGSEPYYPVNDEKNNKLYLRYKALADKEEKVIFGGRLGTYKYLDMDKVVAMALKDSEKDLAK